jgi:WD40 repeat protein
MEEYFSTEFKPEIIEERGQPINKLHTSYLQEATLLSIRNHPTLPWIVVSDSRKNLFILNSESGKLLSPALDVRSNNPFKGSIIATDFHPTRNLLLIGSMDENHAILKLKEKSEEEVAVKVLQTYHLHEKYVVRTKWNPKGNLFATASHDKTVGIYSLNEETLESVFVKQLHFQGAVEAIQFTKDGKQLIVATRDDANLHYVDVENWSKLLVNMNVNNINVNQLPDNHVSFTPLEIILSSDGKKLLVSTDNNLAILFNTGTPHQIRKFYGFRNDGFSQPRAAFDSRNYLYLTSQDFGIHVFDPEKDREVGVLEGHKNVVRDIIYDSNSDMLISVSYDKSVKFWKRDYPESTPLSQ